MHPGPCRDEAGPGGGPVPRLRAGSGVWVLRPLLWLAAHVPPGPGILQLLEGQAGSIQHACLVSPAAPAYWPVPSQLRAVGVARATRGG